MAKLTDQEISDLIEAHEFKTQIPERTDYMGRLVAAYEYVDSGWYAWNDAPDSTFVEGLGLVSIVESFGGEGQGDDYWMIFNVITEEGSTHYKLNGYYASYSGGEYNGPLERVTAHEETITVWR